MKFSEMPYARPNLRVIKSTLNKAKKALKSAKTPEDAVNAVLSIEQPLKEAYTNESLCEVRNTINTKDEFYDAEQKYVDDHFPTLMPTMLGFNKAVAKCPMRGGLDDSFGSHYAAVKEFELKGMSPKIVLEMKRVNTLTRDYQNLLASCKIEFKGQTLNLSGMRKYLQDPDRETRKEAARLTSKFFSDHMNELDGYYDKLVKIRTKMAKKLGFDNFTPLGYINMNRFDYNAQDVARFREQVVTDIVPVCTELLKKQAERIGVDKLRFYDEAYQYPDGNAMPKGTPDELVKAAQQMYRELSKETGEFFDFMVENELMDLVTKENKRVGGYCTSFPQYDAPFIFSNFNGTSADVDVLTHEAGHAFAGMTAGKHVKLMDLMSPSLETCEIHSMSMEFFTHPWMEKFFFEQADKYRYSHAAESVIFVPYGVCVDEFQHVVYDNPDMTPSERRAAWSSLEKKYLPLRDYDGDEYMENGGFWQKQHHIYTSPFYYIDYCLASMGAFEFYGKMKADRAAAWKDYYTLCCAGGTAPYRELLKTANLHCPFEEGSVAVAMKALKEELLGK